MHTLSHPHQHTHTSTPTPAHPHALQTLTPSTHTSVLTHSLSLIRFVVHVWLCCRSAVVDVDPVCSKLSLATVLDVLQQATAGLRHLHHLGILHRDFRAANVLLASRDPLRVVVTDFGVSHRLSSHSTGVGTAAVGSHHDAAVGTVLTGGAALGPVAWMAPESLEGTLSSGRVATPATDVYMVGGLMFEVGMAA